MSQTLDNFKGLDGLSSPSARFFSITPADANLPVVPKALYVGGSGTLVLLPQGGGAAVTFTVFGGLVLPVRPLQVMAASTATGIVGLE